MSDLAEIFNSAIEKSDRCDQCGAITACIGGDSQAKWCCICGAKLWGNHTYAIIDIPSRVWDDEKKQYEYKKIPSTAEVPMPEPIGFIDSDDDETWATLTQNAHELATLKLRSAVFHVSQMRTYGAACRAAGEAARGGEVMKSEQIERRFRDELQYLLDKWGAELEAKDHWKGYPECGEDVRMTVTVPAIYDADHNCLREFTEIDLGSYVAAASEEVKP